jgi:hypothetical protein
MSLWGISTTAETAANNYAIPKHLGRYNAVTSQFDANNLKRTPYNCFADHRGWVYRNYKTSHRSGISSRYTDSILVSAAGLNTAGSGANTLGLGAATPVAVFFEDPNLAARPTSGGGASASISTSTTGYVHVVFNELVYVSAGATLGLRVGVNTSLVAYATSAGAPVNVYMPTVGGTQVTFNGQITNRVSFAFTAPNAVGTTIAIIPTTGIVGTTTEASAGAAVTVSSFSGLIKNVAGAGTTSGVGLGVTTLTIKA